MVAAGRPAPPKPETPNPKNFKERWGLRVISGVSGLRVSGDFGRFLGL